MTIGINAAAAVKWPRTGVEEYTYQLIRHLTMLSEAKGHRFLLYLPDINTRIGTNDTNRLNPSQPLFKKGGERGGVLKRGRESFFDFPLPSNFEVKILRWPWPFLWTQIRLAWEMSRRRPDALFIPAHILPFGAPKNSVVTIHGLEYEYFPNYYPFWQRLYLKWTTVRAFGRARAIIAVSENTKRDLVKWYGGEEEKIRVIYHGVEYNPPTPLCVRGMEESTQGGAGGLKKPYLLYIGRIETKKNIQGILEAYRILKEKYNIPHRLILAGAPGYGYKDLKLKVENYKLEIKELGYVSNDKKWQWLANADLFLFPSFYEGFGLPVLEAQAAGAPVVTSYNSCLPEIAGDGAIFINPENPDQIAETVKQIIDDKNLRDRLIQLGFENVKRFKWNKCAKETLEVLISE